MALERAKYIGGTDCAAILNLSRWKTVLQVWAEKTGQIIPEQKDSEALELGKELEDYVAKRFMRKTGKKVQRVNDVQIHPKYPFIAAQIDRKVIGEDAILECKTASIWKYKEWEGEEIPAEYLLQCHHQLLVTGKEKAYIAVLIGNQDFKWREIQRDEKILKDILKKEIEFWESFVLTQEMPMQISFKDSGALYNLFGKETAGSEIILGDEANQVIEQIEALKEDLNSLDCSIEQKKNYLKALLRENETGKTNLYKVTWKESVYPQRIVKESKARVLRISKLKETDNG